MRSDSIGLFWQDVPKDRSRGAVTRPQPPIPETGWRPPTHYPNLSAAKILAIDTETKDPHLLSMGPGWARNDGHVVGFSIATEDNHAWYFPIRHEVEPEDNLDPESTLAWLRDALGNPEQPKVGANIMYDVGWLRHEGVHVAGRCYDVQFAEALIDEAKFSYSLDSIANKYLDMGKDTNLLYQWCADYYGGKTTSEQGKNFYRTPPRLMGPYGETDAVLPMQLLGIQNQILEQRGMTSLFDLECRLIPLLVDMRYRGVKVDIQKAEQVRDQLVVQEQQYQDALNKLAGFHVDVYAAKQIAKVFEKMGLKYTRTAKGNPSFTKDWLEANPEPLAQHIVTIRKLQKARGTFIESAILEKNVDGRLYCQFHPLKSDSGGTVSGRFSSSTPNLQQVPARDEIMAPLVRQCFVPDDGFPQWLRGDYSQIEYRLLAHYAVGRGADQIRQRYQDDPTTDYHAATSDLIKSMTGINLGRKPTKNINFGLVYGMGKYRLKRSLGVDDETGENFFTAYHDGVPFVSETFDAAMAEVNLDGVSRTILNRQSHFSRFAPPNDREAKALPYEEAVATYGTNIERAYTHKSLNRKLQGSSADIIKAGMVMAYEGGIFAEMGGVPHITVHDELDTSYHPDTRHAVRRLKECMETVIPLSVPITLDLEVGSNWASVKQITI